jgi:hypothetical protein
MARVYLFNFNDVSSLRVNKVCPEPYNQEGVFILVADNRIEASLFCSPLDRIEAEEWVKAHNELVDSPLMKALK